MDSTYLVIISGLACLVGGLVGYFIRQIVANQQIRSTKKQAQGLLDEATTKHAELLSAAREEAIKVRNVAEAENKERRLELQRVEKRLSQRE